MGESRRGVVARVVFGVMAVAAVMAGVVLAGGPARAQDPPTTAVCVQVPNTANTVDDAFITRFMNQQLAEGRTRFQTVTGISTALCAW